jgi:uncharacterized protein YrrD
MLIKAKTLKGYKLDANDGEIGKVRDVYFDDRYWTIRYLVADTGSWLVDRKVLISPYALAKVNQEERHIPVELTKARIENSPSLDSDKPVSRQFEEAYHGFYEWPAYWTGHNIWGYYPDILRDSKKKRAANEAVRASNVAEKASWDPNLRSIYDVNGRDVEATDGEIGHVDDFIVDDKTWTLRYIVIDTRNWWPGKKVLVSPKWIERVSWSESKVFINLTRGAIKESPEYTESSLISRDYEIRLHEHYDRQGYWVDETSKTG